MKKRFSTGGKDSPGPATAKPINSYGKQVLGTKKSNPSYGWGNPEAAQGESPSDSAQQNRGWPDYSAAEWGSGCWQSRRAGSAAVQARPLATTDVLHSCAASAHRQGCKDLQWKVFMKESIKIPLRIL